MTDLTEARDPLARAGERDAADREARAAPLSYDEIFTTTEEFP